jgi:hypothetical protein
LARKFGVDANDVYFHARQLGLQGQDRRRRPGWKRREGKATLYGRGELIEYGDVSGVDLEAGHKALSARLMVRARAGEAHAIRLLWDLWRIVLVPVAAWDTEAT